jgi:hypothetical protein
VPRVMLAQAPSDAATHTIATIRILPPEGCCCGRL